MVASIARLEQVVENLPRGMKRIFKGIFEVSTSVGHLFPQPSFLPKAKEYFGNGEEDEEQAAGNIAAQTILKTFNKYTLEEALFNKLRTSKPGSKPDCVSEARKKVDEYVKEELKGKECDFCNPIKFTPINLPRRIFGKYCVTAANAAKYDALHSLLIFEKHNPFDFNEKEISDYVETSFKWFSDVSAQYTGAVYPFLMWNCMPRSGASQVHGHMHLLLTGDMPYEGIQRLKAASDKYRKEYSSDYFQDLFSVHEALGLGFKNTSNVMVYITPAKDKETLILANNTDDLKKPLYQALRCFIDNLGVFSFNVAFQMPPLSRMNGWKNFPYVVRIVDRGNPFGRGTDIGAMELYGSKVIGSDQFLVAEALKSYCTNTSAEKS